MKISLKRLMLTIGLVLAASAGGFAQVAITSLSPNLGTTAGGYPVTIYGSGFITTSNTSNIASVNFGNTSVPFNVSSDGNSINVTTSANSAGTVDVVLTTLNGTTARLPSAYTFDTAPVYVNPSITVNVTQNVAYTSLNAQLVVSDPDAGQTETFTTQTPPTHGIVSYQTSTGGSAVNATANSGSMSITTNGVVLYTPNTGYTGTDSFVIKVSDGSYIANETVNVGVYALPTINAVTPNYGTVSGGTSVSITGNNLASVSLVTFNSVNAASFTYNSTTNSIIAVSPSGNAGAPIDIAVVNPGGATTPNAADKFTYYNTPIVTALSTGNGPLTGGSIITITGNYFLGGGITPIVKFGTTNAPSITVNSTTLITATVPTLNSGNVDVTVATLGGTSVTSNADRYTAYYPPSVTAISTNSGSMAGGTSVVITGTSLTAVSTVNFGTVSAPSFTVNSDTQITAVAPAGAQAVVDIVVRSPGGYSSTSSADQFSYYATPIIAWSNPADIIYPTPLSSTQLTANATYNGAAVAGVYTYTPASGTLLNPGTQTLNVVFTPNNTTAYASANAFVTLNVDNAPTITTQPQSISAMAGTTANISVVATGFPPPSYQWYFNGAPIAGATSATLTTNNVQAANAGNYTVFVSNNINSALSSVATLTVTYPASAPVFTVSPTTTALTIGTSATLTATATGNPAPTYQWYFNGVAITGATASSLSIPNAQPGNSGSYTVVATNTSGSVTSNAAFVTANPASGAPTFSLQPASQVVSPSSTVVFLAASTANATYQWYLNGKAIIGATKASYTTTAVPANYGNYQCMAVTPTGAVISSIATISPVTTSNPGRLVNISVLTLDAPGSQLLTLGFVSGGAGTSGTQSLLVRGIGPALTAYNVTGVLPDPKISLFNGSTLVNSNAGWGSTVTNITQVNAADTATGAFTLPNTSSLDSAMVQTLSSAAYTVQVSSPSNSTGNALAEVYDNTPAASYTATTPRLINLSCLQRVNANGLLTAGFSISGMTAKTVLIRASGPTLSGFNVSGTMPDPSLALYSGSTVIASNTGWGGDAAISSAAASVYAFAFASSTSKDSALLVTLTPGTYTVQVTSASGVAGTTLVEVYEVP